jgi:low temperature requirement protein LtrA
MNVFYQGRHIWWQKPKMRTDENFDIERKATWLELFFDLIFVAILAQLTHALYAHLTLGGLGSFIFLFIPAWWIWNSITFYNERYEVNDIRHRIITFLNMIPMAGVAFSVHGAMGETANIFAISFIASRVLLIYMWLTAGESKIERKLSVIFSVGFAVSVVLWIASLFITAPIKFYVWGIALIIDLIIPMITLKTQMQLPKISTSHIPERFGLLIILTIGETVIGSVNGLAGNIEFSVQTVFACLLGLCISFLVWWLYVDNVTYRVFKRGVWYILAWAYLHLPLAICITAIGAGILSVVSMPASQEISLALHWLLCGAVSCYLLIMALIGIVSENVDHHHNVIHFHKTINRKLLTVKIVSIILMLGVGFFGSSFNAISLLTLIIIILLIPSIHGLHLWVKSHIENSNN